ncbi:MAG: N-glycosylase/DNA lyase [Candidatus Thermoplasmatota archaeon]|nr:N-glycosylase/DNA lyase [Candidatus Thermoplasmatota archaeon]
MSLIDLVKALRETNVEAMIAQRALEFSDINKKESTGWFLELCFCIMTANFTAERAMRIQESIGKGFLTMDENELAITLKSLGHRFPNSRARYIAKAREYAQEIKETLEPLDRAEKREWLVDKICGMGYKEASHFLRNTGHFDYAIIDFHILDLLEKEKIIRKPDNLSKNVYLAIEKKLQELAEELSMPVGILDLYLWFIETGKVLK